MAHIKSLCVYCGSSPGRNSHFAEISRNFGTILAQEKIRLVYGGGNIGLMGIIANRVIKCGGKVTGIIPRHLNEIEAGWKEATDFFVVDNMHERKRMMFDHSDGFIVLPGSIGTLDEAIEIITWKQLRLHNKPVILVNADNYWQPLLALIDNFIAEEFTRPETLELFQVVETVEDVIPLLKSLPEIDNGARNILI